MNTRHSARIQTAIIRHLRIGVAMVFATVAGVGGWAVATEIAGAVIASGQVIVESNVKRVQHPNGGIVAELNVREGEAVTAGAVVIRLDDTIARASFEIVSKSLDEQLARKARLTAERDGVDHIEFPDGLRARDADPVVRSVLSGETRLFELRKTASKGQIEQLKKRIAQSADEILGVTRQVDAKAREISLIKRELEGARELWNKKLMPISKLTALEREGARVEGEHGALQASIARVNGKIAETDLQIVQIGHDLTSDVAKQLADIDARISELVERKAASEDQLKRVDIRAPVAGKVHQLAVYTVGGVIKGGDTLMLIVPEADRLAVEARVTPREIDQLQLGQAVRLRFTAFNQNTTPEINGTLERVSADVSTDQRNETSFYTARIGISELELSRLGTLRLVPGMPAEVFIETAKRRVVSYLVRPLHDQMTRAFREK